MNQVTIHQNVSAKSTRLNKDKVKLDYMTITIFSLVAIFALIATPLFGYFYGYSSLDWILFGVLYLVSGLGITVGYHRLLSHRSFTCVAPVKIALLIAGGWALENSALKWCSDHIRHHAKTDTDEDPYNAKKGFWHSHVGWIFIKNENPGGREKYKTALRKDKWIMWQDRNYLAVLASGLVLPFVIGFLHRGWIGAFSAFLLAGVFRVFLVLNSTFFINSICHIWGTQPYGDANSSRDNWWISLLTFGEGYHNYHHNFPRDYRNGPKWYNFDPSKWVIFSFFVLRLGQKSS
ncbi:MAG: acyl-CoA desaturase [Nitrospira sp.]